MARRGTKTFRSSYYRKSSWEMESRPSGALASARVPLCPRAVKGDPAARAAGTSANASGAERLTKEAVAAARAVATTAVGAVAASTVAVHGDSTPTLITGGPSASSATALARREDGTRAGASTGTLRLTQKDECSTQTLGRKEGVAAGDTEAGGLSAAAQKILSAGVEAKMSGWTDPVTGRGTVAALISAPEGATVAYGETAKRTSVKNASTGKETHEMAARVRAASVETNVSAKNGEASLRTATAAATPVNAQGGDTMMKRTDLGVQPIAGACSAPATSTWGNRKNSERFFIGEKKGHTAIFVRRERPGIATSKVTPGKTAVYVAASTARANASATCPSTVAADVNALSIATTDNFLVTTNSIKPGILHAAGITEAKRTGIAHTVVSSASSAPSCRGGQTTSKGERTIGADNMLNAVALADNPRAPNSAVATDLPAAEAAIGAAIAGETAVEGSRQCVVTSVLPQSSLATEVGEESCQATPASRAFARTGRTPGVVRTGIPVTKLKQIASVAAPAAARAQAMSRCTSGSELSPTREIQRVLAPKENGAEDVVETTAASGAHAAGAPGCSGDRAAELMVPNSESADFNGSHSRNAVKAKNGFPETQDDTPLSKVKLKGGPGLIGVSEDVNGRMQERSVASHGSHGNRRGSGPADVTLVGVVDVKNGAERDPARCRSEDNSSAQTASGHAGINTSDTRGNSSDNVSIHICGDNSEASDLFGASTGATIKESKSTSNRRDPSALQQEATSRNGERIGITQQSDETNDSHMQNQKLPKDRDEHFVRKTLKSQPSEEKTGLDLSRNEKTTRVQPLPMHMEYEEHQQQQHRLPGHLEGSGPGESCLHQQKHSQKDNRLPLDVGSQARHDGQQKQQVAQPHRRRPIGKSNLEECLASDNLKSDSAQITVKESDTAAAQQREREITETSSVSEPSAATAGPRASSFAIRTRASQASTRSASAPGPKRTASANCMSPHTVRRRAASESVPRTGVKSEGTAARRASAMAASNAATLTGRAIRATAKTFHGAAHLQKITQKSSGSTHEQIAPDNLLENVQASSIAINDFTVLGEEPSQSYTPLKSRKVGEEINIVVAPEGLRAYRSNTTCAAEAAREAARRTITAAESTSREATQCVNMSVSYTPAASDEDENLCLWHAEGEIAIEDLSPVVIPDELYEWEVGEIGLPQQKRERLQHPLQEGRRMNPIEVDEQQDSHWQDGQRSRQERYHARLLMESTEPETQQQQQCEVLHLSRRESRLPIRLDQSREESRLQLRRQGHQWPWWQAQYEPDHWDEAQLQTERSCSICEKDITAFINAMPCVVRVYEQERQRLKNKAQGLHQYKQDIEKHRFPSQRNEHSKQHASPQDCGPRDLVPEPQSASQERFGHAAQKHRPRGHSQEREEHRVCETGEQKKDTMQGDYQYGYEAEEQRQDMPSDQTGEQKKDTMQGDYQYGYEAEEQRQDMPSDQAADVSETVAQNARENPQNPQISSSDDVRTTLEKKLSKLKGQQESSCIEVQLVVDGTDALAKSLEHRKAQHDVMQRQASLLQQQSLHIDQQQATLQKQRCQIRYIQQCITWREGELLQLKGTVSPQQQLPAEQTIAEPFHQQPEFQIWPPHREHVGQTLRRKQLLQALLQHEYDERSNEARRDQQFRRSPMPQQEAGSNCNMQEVKQTGHGTAALDKQQQCLFSQLMQELSNRQGQQQQECQLLSEDLSDILVSREEIRDVLPQAEQQKQQRGEQFQVAVEQQHPQNEDYPWKWRQEEENLSQAGILPQCQYRLVEYSGSVSASLERTLIKLTSSDTNLNADAEAHIDSVRRTNSVHVQEGFSTCAVPAAAVPATNPSAGLPLAPASATAAPLPAASPLGSVLPAASAAGCAHPVQPLDHCQADNDIRHHQKQGGLSNGEHDKASPNVQVWHINSQAIRHLAPVEESLEETSPAASDDNAGPTWSAHRRTPENYQVLYASSLTSHAVDAATPIGGPETRSEVPGCAASTHAAPGTLATTDSCGPGAPGCIGAVVGATPAPAAAAAFAAVDQASTPTVNFLSAAAELSAVAGSLKGPGSEAGSQKHSREVELWQAGGEDLTGGASMTTTDNAVGYFSVKDVRAVASALGGVAGRGREGNDAVQTRTAEATAGVAVLLEAWDWSGNKAAREDRTDVAEIPAAETSLARPALTAYDGQKDERETERHRRRQAVQEEAQPSQQQMQQHQHENTPMQLAENQYADSRTDSYGMNNVFVPGNKHSEGVQRTAVNALSRKGSSVAANGNNATRGEALFEGADREEDPVEGVASIVGQAVTAAADPFIVRPGEIPATGEKAAAAAAGICGAVGAEKEAPLPGRAEISEPSASHIAFHWAFSKRNFYPYSTSAADSSLHVFLSDCEQQRLRPKLNKHSRHQHFIDSRQQHYQQGVGDDQLQKPLTSETGISHRAGIGALMQTERGWDNVAPDLAPFCLSPSAITPFSAEPPLSSRPLGYSNPAVSLQSCVAGIPAALTIPDAASPSPYNVPYVGEGREQFTSHSAKPVLSAATAPAQVDEERASSTREELRVRPGTVVKSQPEILRTSPRDLPGVGVNECSSTCCKNVTIMVLSSKEGNRQREAGCAERSNSWSYSATEQQHLTRQIYSPLPALSRGRLESYEHNSLQTNLFATAVTVRGPPISDLTAAALPHTTAALSLPKAVLTRSPSRALPLTPRTPAAKLCLSSAAATPVVALTGAQAASPHTTTVPWFSPATATAFPVESTPILSGGSSLPTASPSLAPPESSLTVKSAGPPEVSSLSVPENSSGLNSATICNKQYYTDAASLCRIGVQPQVRPRQEIKQVHPQLEQQAWPQEQEDVQGNRAVEKIGMWLPQIQNRRETQLLQPEERQRMPVEDGPPPSPETLLSSEDPAKMSEWHMVSADSPFAARHKREGALLQQQPKSNVQQQPIMRLHPVPGLAATAAAKESDQKTPDGEEFYPPPPHTTRSEVGSVGSVVATRSRSAAPGLAVPMPPAFSLTYASDKDAVSALCAIHSLSAACNTDSRNAAITMRTQTGEGFPSATAPAVAATPSNVLEQFGPGSSLPPSATARPGTIPEVESSPSHAPHPRRHSPASGGPGLPTVCTGEWTNSALRAAMKDCREALEISPTFDLQAPQMRTVPAGSLTRDFRTGLAISSRADEGSAADTQSTLVYHAFATNQHCNPLSYRSAQEGGIQDQLTTQRSDRWALLQQCPQRLETHKQEASAEPRLDLQQEQELHGPQLQQTRLQQQEPQVFSPALQMPTTEEARCGFVSSYCPPPPILRHFQPGQSLAHPAATEAQRRPRGLCAENCLTQPFTGMTHQQQQHEQSQEPQPRCLSRDEREQGQWESSTNGREEINERSAPYVSAAPQEKQLTPLQGTLSVQPENHAPPVQTAHNLFRQKPLPQKPADAVSEKAAVDIHLTQEAAEGAVARATEHSAGDTLVRNSVEAAAAAPHIPWEAIPAFVDAIFEERTDRRLQHAAARLYNPWDDTFSRSAKQWSNNTSTSKSRNRSCNAIAVCVGRVEEGPRTRSPMACRSVYEKVLSERHNAAAGMKQRRASLVRLSGATGADLGARSGVGHQISPRFDEGIPSSSLYEAERTTTAAVTIKKTTAAGGGPSFLETGESWEDVKSHIHVLPEYEAEEKASDLGCSSRTGDRGRTALTGIVAGETGSHRRKAVHMQQQRLTRSRGLRVPWTSVHGRYVVHRQGETGWREEFPTPAPPPPPPPLRDRRADHISTGTGKREATETEQGGFSSGSVRSNGFGGADRASVFPAGRAALPALPPRAPAGEVKAKISGRRSTSACPSAGRGRRLLLQQQVGETAAGGRYLSPHTGVTDCRGSRPFPAQHPQSQQQPQYSSPGLGGGAEDWSVQRMRQSSSHVEAKTASMEYIGCSRVPRKGYLPNKEEEGLSAVVSAFSAVASTAERAPCASRFVYNCLRNAPAAATTAATTSSRLVAPIADSQVSKTHIARQSQQSLPPTETTEPVRSGTETLEEEAGGASVHGPAQVRPGGWRGHFSSGAGGKAISSERASFYVTASEKEGFRPAHSSDGRTAGRNETPVGQGEVGTEGTEQQELAEASAAAAARGTDGMYYVHLTAKGTSPRSVHGGRTTAAEMVARNDSGTGTEVAPDATRARSEIEGARKMEEEQGTEEKGLTTVMLRNIPNKYNRQQVMKEIDVHFKGTYDFFYLPIDFVHGCNVGYCFINFVDVATAEAFRQEFEGKRLSLFKSKKICSVTYGRVQGLKAILEHYFHSAVVQVQYASWRPVVLKNCVELPWSELHHFFPELFENKLTASSSSSASPTKRDPLPVSASQRGHRSSSVSSASSSSSFACAHPPNNSPFTTGSAADTASGSVTTAKGTTREGGAAALAMGTGTTASKNFSEAHGGDANSNDDGNEVKNASMTAFGVAEGRPARSERGITERESGGGPQGGTVTLGTAWLEHALDVPGAERDIAAKWGNGQVSAFASEDARKDSEIQAARKGSEADSAERARLHAACGSPITTERSSTGGATQVFQEAEDSEMTKAATGGSGHSGANPSSAGGSLLSRRLSVGRRRGRKLGVTIEARKRELRNLASRYVSAAKRCASYRESFAAAVTSAARQCVPQTYSPGSNLRFYAKSSIKGDVAPDASVPSLAASARQANAPAFETSTLPVPAPKDYTRTAAGTINVVRCRGYIHGGRAVAFDESVAQGTAPAAGGTNAASGGVRSAGGGKKPASAAGGDGLTPITAGPNVQVSPIGPPLPLAAAGTPAGSSTAARGKAKRPQGEAAANRSYLNRTASISTAGGVSRQPQRYINRAEAGGREGGKYRVYHERLTRGGRYFFKSKNLYSSQKRLSSSTLHNNKFVRQPGATLHHQLPTTPERRERRTEVQGPTRADLQATN